MFLRPSQVRRTITLNWSKATIHFLIFFSFFQYTKEKIFKTVQLFERFFVAPKLIAVSKKLHTILTTLSHFIKYKLQRDAESPLPLCRNCPSLSYLLKWWVLVSFLTRGFSPKRSKLLLKKLNLLGLTPKFMNTSGQKLRMKHGSPLISDFFTILIKGYWLMHFFANLCRATALAESNCLSITFTTSNHVKR